MVARENEGKKLDFMLLQESLWKIEDRLSVFVESIADHEAELARLKRTLDLLSRRMDSRASAERRIRSKGDELGSG